MNEDVRPSVAIRSEFDVPDHINQQIEELTLKFLDCLPSLKTNGDVTVILSAIQRLNTICICHIVDKGFIDRDQLEGTVARICCAIFRNVELKSGVVFKGLEK